MRLLPFSAALLGSVLLAACSGAASPTPASQSAAASAAQPVASGAGSNVASSAAKPVASGSAAASAAAGLKKMDVVLSSLSGDSIPVWVAQEGGYFAKNGLEVNLQLINGAAAAMATLISGKVQLGHLGGSAVLTSAAAGADV